MVKLDAQVLRYMSKDEFRVLTAVEMGMKNHQIVPTALIVRIAGLKKGGVKKLIGSLHKNKLIYHDASKYDGYKLTYMGYDYLALKAMVNRGVISGIGSKIGVGKESDIYEVCNDKGESMVLKVHRLGRVSFRSIKTKRDYLEHRTSASWLYMSRLAALREFTYMKALHAHGFPTPVPYDQSRHCIVMSLCPAFPFVQVRRIRHVGKVYAELMNLIVRLAEHGLIHCDFNEFNIMIDPAETITMIDFPQMISTEHPNAKEYFERDVNCIRTYFSKKFKYDSDDYPRFFKDTKRKIDLDKDLSASGSGFTAKQKTEFERFVLTRPGQEGEDDESDEGDDLDEEEEKELGLDDLEEEEEEGNEEEESEESEEEEGGQKVRFEARRGLINQEAMQGRIDGGGLGQPKRRTDSTEAVADTETGRDDELGGVGEWHREPRSVSHLWESPAPQSAAAAGAPTVLASSRQVQRAKREGPTGQEAAAAAAAAGAVGAATAEAKAEDAGKGEESESSEGRGGNGGGDGDVEVESPGEGADVTPREDPATVAMRERARRKVRAKMAKSSHNSRVKSMFRRNNQKDRGMRKLRAGIKEDLSFR